MKRLIKIIYFFSPPFIKQVVLERKQKMEVEKVKLRLKEKVSKDYIRELFNKLDIANDVFIHSSLVDIGRIEGGHKYLIECLNSSILEKGYTMLFSALPFKGSSLEFLRSISEFDVKKAPVFTGTINEYYASLPEAKRSLSPTHSVVVVGGKALYYTNEHHLTETPFKENSPYYKLLLQKGKVLMLGATLNHLTLAHLIEDLMGEDFPVRVYTHKLYDVNLINEDNVLIKGKFKAHNRLWSLLKSEDFVINSLRNLPSTQIYKLGFSELILLDACDVIIFLLDLLKKGETVYGNFRLSKIAKEKVDSLIEHFKNL